MSSSLHPSSQEILKRFNLRFPKFYEQFVSTEIQLENLGLARKLYQTRQVVICTEQEGEKTAIHFAAPNQPSLLRDVFGVLAAYNLTAHNLSIHGQIQSPTLIFMRLTVTRGGKPLTGKTQENICRALREALAGRFEVEEMLSVERFENDYLEDVRTEFYIDQVFHLPALLVEGNTQEGVFYKIANAMAPENLLVVNANLIVWQGRTRLILYVLNRQASSIPDYLGHKLADRVKQRLTQPV
ncbi:MAG: hypothetical protein HC771_20720 [Synechococcales cyanobacterium CRU_2_2]|nr:hypothetical protein [Synechococcales cyanobacterium CRU_2_2]